MNVNDFAAEEHTHVRNIEAEQAIIGAVLSNNGAFDDVRNILRAEMFYEAAHAEIYRALSAEISAGRLVDPVTLLVACADLNRAYLAQCAAAAVSIVDAKSYATVVRECWHRRVLAEIFYDAGNRCGTSDYVDGPASIVGDVRAKLDEFDRDMIDDTIQPVPAVLDSLESRVAAAPPPISTGLPMIDASLDGGLRPGSLYAIEAPAKTFKTGTLGTIALSLIRDGVPMLFVSAEMDSENIMARMVAAEGRCNARHLLDRERTSDSLGKIRAFRDRHGDRPGFFAYRPGITHQGLSSLCATAVAKLGVKVVFVDYWQRIRGCGARQSRAEFLEGIADWSADFAASHQVSVVMASQLNRDGDSFGSGGLERACAWLAKLHKAESEDRFAGQQETLWMEIARSRYSMSGNIGSNTSPAFRIDGVGPVLREIGDWVQAA